MKCGKCDVQKLSREFPPWTLVESCNHAVLHCLRCVTAHAEQHGQCSQCGNDASQTSSRLKQCYYQLKALFPEYEPTFVPQTATVTTGETGYISMAMLNGDSTSVQLNPAMTVSRLKEIIRQSLKVPLENQQLVYNGKEMKELTDTHAQATLGSYQVVPKTTIHVRRLLYAAPSGLDKVVFDLYWGYPTNGRDYLDASVLVFEGVKLLYVLDYRHTVRPAMCHSGDLMDDYARKGHHLIKVNLHSIPSATTHLFFTLSAWNSPTVSRYPNPSLRFYEESNPGKMLCEDTIKKLNYSQAIVMGWLARHGGKWCVFSAGKASAGNAKNYSCLVSTIQGIIINGL
ncbi:uncharacterized protein LOC110980998 [Acanthaster planci]|uniref:Uncharacterized protein LOC110980998 n=1 Tax=Acanthaster planci TaxID=133434 RepID=A0A8B7YKL7_ACAPL|nr:uncharacterized protein LOC110980998 [Acanthaster planci]